MLGALPSPLIAAPHDVAAPPAVPRLTSVGRSGLMSDIESTGRGRGRHRRRSRRSRRCRRGKVPRGTFSASRHAGNLAGEHVQPLGELWTVWGENVQPLGGATRTPRDAFLRSL